MLTEKSIVEVLARHECIVRGISPEYLEPGNCPSGCDDEDALIVADGYRGNGDFCHFAWRGFVPQIKGQLLALNDEGYRVYRKDEVEGMLKALENIAGYPTYEPAAQELQRIASAALLTIKGQTNA